MPSPFSLQRGAFDPLIPIQGGASSTNRTTTATTIDPLLPIARKRTSGGGGGAGAAPLRPNPFRPIDPLRIISGGPNMATRTSTPAVSDTSFTPVDAARGVRAFGRFGIQVARDPKRAYHVGAKALESGLLSTSSTLETTTAVMLRKLVPFKKEFPAAQYLSDKLMATAKVDRELSKYGLMIEEPVNWIEGLNDPFYVIQKVLQNVPNTAAALAVGGLGFAVGGPVGARIGLYTVSAGLEGGNAYQDAIDHGADERTAEKVMIGVGLINGVIEMLPADNLLRQAFGKGTVRSTVGGYLTEAFVSAPLKQGFLEGGTEAVQEVVGNAFARAYDENRDLFANVGQSAFFGTLSGLGSSVALSAVQSSVSVTKSVRDTIKAGFINDLVNKGYPLEEAQGYAEQGGFIGQFKPKQIDNLTKDEMIKAIDYVRLKKSYDQTMEDSIGHLAEKFGIKSKSLATVANQFERLVEETKTRDISGRVLKTDAQRAGFETAMVRDSLFSSISKAKTSGQSFDEWVKGQEGQTIDDIDYLGLRDKATKDFVQNETGKRTLPDNVDWENLQGHREHGSPLTDRTYEWLDNYLRERKIQNPTDDIVMELEYFVPDRPIKVYRGGEMNKNVGGVKVNSWTHNLEVANKFAGKLGKVYEVTIEPKDILFDSKMVDPNYDIPTFSSWEDEVLVWSRVKGNEIKTRSQLKAEWDKASGEQFINRDEAGFIKLPTKEEMVGAWRRITGVAKSLLPTKVIPITPSERAGTATPAGKTVAQVFRTDKLNLTEEQIDQIEKRREVLGLTTRGVRSFTEMQEVAQELGTDVETLLKEIITNRITDSEVIALRETINANAQFIAQAEEQITNVPSYERLLRPKINQASVQIDKSITKLIKGGTEAGRTVAAFRVIARNTLDPIFWFKKAKEQLGGARPLTAEMQAAILDLVKKHDINGLANFVSMLREASFAEQAITLWKAGLLTASTTHLANLGGNTTMASLMTASDVSATVFDVIASVFTGQRTTTITPSTVYAKARGLAIGVPKAWEYLKTGIYPEDVLKKYDMRQVRFKSKILQGYTQAVFRSLGAEDIMFRMAAMAESFQKQAIVMVMNEGLHGQDAKTRIADLLTNPTNEMTAVAMEAAEYATFQSKNIMSSAISAAKSVVRSKSEIAAAGVEVIAPFTTTPTNIAARIIDISPAGFVTTLIKTARNIAGKKGVTTTQRQLVEGLGRATTGTVVIAIGAFLAARGLMTGNLPDDEQERREWERERKLPNAILIGGRWYQLNRVSPIGNLLALGAEFHELGEENIGSKRYAKTGLAALEGLSEQTFLKGISGAVGAIFEPERKGEYFLEGTVSSVIPTVIGRIATTIDPRSRIREGVLDAVMAKIPGLTGKLAIKRDLFGDPINVAGGKYNLVDPFQSKKARNDAIIKEIQKVDANIGMPSQTISGIKLTAHEYSIYQKVQGRLLEASFTQLVDSPQYKKAKPSDRKEAFENIQTELRSNLNDQLFPALMVKRYGLDTKTNPELLRVVLEGLSDIQRFKNASVEEQGKMIIKVIDASNVGH